MSTDNEVPLARPGDLLAGTDLRPAADELIALADELLPDVEKARTPRQLAQVLKANGDLLAQARVLVQRDIALVTGEAHVHALQVQAAIVASRQAIAKVTKLQSRLAKAGAVIDFVATVLTGSGTKIFNAARTLNQALALP